MALKLPFSRKKLALIMIVVLAVGFGAIKIFGPKTTPVQYQTQAAAKGTLVTSVSASGTITSGNMMNITTQATGVVSAVYVKNGDTVVQGQKIADINLDQTGQQKQTQAWASYLSAKNTLALAQANINSLQVTLFSTNQKFINDAVERNLTTDDPTYIQENAAWLQAEDNYNNQATVISQAQANLTSAWYSYQQTSPTVTAPISGVVSNLTLTPGVPILSPSSTTSSSQQQVGSIILPQGRTQASVNIAEIDAPKVAPGQKVTMTLDAFPNQTFTGKILLIDTNGIVSSGVTTYPATILFDTNVDHVYPNMAVTAQIITSVKDNVILVPTTAIQTSGGQSTVRILKNGHLTTVPVQIGGSNDTDTEITSGVSVGDEVVTSSVSSTTTSGSNSSSPFSPFGGNRGFGGGGGAVVRFRTGG